MSLLNQLFNRGVFGAKCKTSLTLSLSRIKLLQNKRDLQLRRMRKEIAQFLQAGQEAIAGIRVEHIIREQNIVAAYGILELFCEFVLARTPILESQKELPIELKEAVASIIFSATRCSEVPDLLTLKNLFTTKYGKEFVAAISELRPDSGVNRTIIEKLSVNAPPGEEKLKVLKEIAREYNLEWDSSSAEAEFCKKHEDLLAGSGTALSQMPVRQDSYSSASNNTHPNMSSNSNKGSSQPLQAPQPPSNMPLLKNSEIESSPRDIPYEVKSTSPGTKMMTSRPSDVLEKARAAIAAADRATAAARAAADLANVKS
ncbi:uncharacterized protein [Rutidosis leptorrhynchoides]|uniref:uncharacterized protein n=1 Tax=Rutidosis leptorrhynchoides TaxID=125765 RepID=UPI003A9922DC